MKGLPTRQEDGPLEDEHAASVRVIVRASTAIIQTDIRSSGRGINGRVIEVANARIRAR